MKFKADSPAVITLVVSMFLVLLVVGDLSAVDYFADGCIVDYETVITKKQPDGTFVSYHGEMCHQYFIHTPSGKRRQTF